MANFLTEGKTSTHSARSSQYLGMESGMPRISVSTWPAFLRRSCSFSWAKAENGSMARARRKQSVLFMGELRQRDEKPGKSLKGRWGIRKPELPWQIANWIQLCAVSAGLYLITTFEEGEHGIRRVQNAPVCCMIRGQPTYSCTGAILMTTIFRYICVLCLVLGLSGTVMVAQSKKLRDTKSSANKKSADKKTPKQAEAAQPAATTASEEKAAADPLANIKFRNLGPAAGGGRVTAVVGVPGQPNIYYVGAAGGG